MDLKWKTEKKPTNKDRGPYAHWWEEKEMPYLPADLLDDRNARLDLEQPFRLKSREGQRLSDAFYAGGAIVPLPVGAGNGGKIADWDEDRTKAKLPLVPDDTVLVGIVDTGIALSNSRFRSADGETRFIAAWQQSAPFIDQSDLPCGQEIYASDIQAKLKEHSQSDVLGYVDETAFNRDLYLTEPTKPAGQRDLEMAAAHGTHVLDLAAGLDPDGSQADLADRLRLIAVNLPAQYAHGTAGGFLAYFAVFAIDRIIHLADALWKRNNPDKDGGYPLVINFSYGMTAGPKDGTHVFERAIERILQEREARQRRTGSKGAPIRLLLPAGNDNLERCAASCVLGCKDKHHANTGDEAQPSVTLPWRILPADTTANFVEIWFESRSQDDLITLMNDLVVSVSPPGTGDMTLEPLQLGRYQDLGSFARVYVSASETKPGQSRLALLICVAPTVSDNARAPIAPAGLWQVKVEYNGEPVDTSFYVQSDQSAVRTSKTGRRSYFDHEKYRVNLENGSPADTFSYEPNQGNVTDNDYWPTFGPVQRKGTHNSLATLGDGNVVTVGGFDDCYGYPANYSSSANENRTKPVGSEAITVSYPSENSPSLFGLLAAGARDGSVTAYRGTSMATALATREAAFAFLGRKGSGERLGNEFWFRKRAETSEQRTKFAKISDHWGQYLGWPSVRLLKSGVGRIDSPDVDRMWKRLGGTK